MDTVIEYRFERTNMDGFRIDTVVEYRFEKTIVVVGLVNFIVYSVKQNVTLIIPIPAVAPTPPPSPASLILHGISHWAVKDHLVCHQVHYFVYMLPYCSTIWLNGLINLLYIRNSWCFQQLGFIWCIVWFSASFSCSSSPRSSLMQQGTKIVAEYIWLNCQVFSFSFFLLEPIGQMSNFRNMVVQGYKIHIQYMPNSEKQNVPWVNISFFWMFRKMNV